MIEGKKNDKQDGSGVLFDIVVNGDKKNGPSQEGIEVKCITDPPVANHEKLEQGLGECEFSLVLLRMLLDSRQFLRCQSGKAMGEILMSLPHFQQRPRLRSSAKQRSGMKFLQILKRVSNLASAKSTASKKKANSLVWTRDSLFTFQTRQVPRPFRVGKRRTR